MTITYHPAVTQGSDEWFALRCGLITASEMDRVISASTLKPIGLKKDGYEPPAHLWELGAQRVTKYTEPQYVGDAMLRGHEDEILAKAAYAKAYAPVEDVGFVTNDKWGFTIGYSPDALVAPNGQKECKSRVQKYQFQTICENAMPDDFRIQVQTGLLVTEREWCDFSSYSGGMHMFTLRIYPDAAIQSAIIAAASLFEETLAKWLRVYRERLADPSARLIPTERRVEQEMVI